MKTTLDQIDTFLSQRRVAVIGASRNPKELSYLLWQELRQRRYQAFAVNPATAELDGQRCYAAVGEIQPPVEAALIMTSAAVAERVVDECAAAGVTNVWLYRGMGGGCATEAAVARAEGHGMNVVAGHCPYMFLPGAPAAHAIHRFGKKLTGGYPKAAPKACATR